MIENEEDTIWLGSIDIGKKTFSFYIEEINVKEISKIKNIQKISRYNVNGTATKDFTKILEQIYKNGKRILLKSVDITDGEEDKGKYFDNKWCYNMFDVLDEYQDLWENVSIIIVEKQMAFGKKINTMALKLGMNCQSYFMLNYKRNIKIIEFPAYYKTITLACEKDMSKTKTGKITYKNIGDRARKKWTVEETFGILNLREDFDTMAEIGLDKKKDDKCDTICQLQAFKYLYFVEKMEF
jgi:hypothetical protein